MQDTAITVNVLKLKSDKVCKHCDINDIGDQQPKSCRISKFAKVNNSIFNHLINYHDFLYIMIYDELWLFKEKQLWL
jgi:hypothetical protein